MTAQPDLPEAWMLAGLAERGYAMRVMCEPTARNFGLLERSAAEVVPLTITRRFDSRAVRAVRAELEAFEPDILHLFNNRAVLNGLRAARTSTAKIVAYRGNVGNVSVLDPVAWLRYLNPRVDRIICVADAVRDSLLAVGFPGCRIAPGKLVTIRKGHDAAWYAARPVERSTLGVSDDAFLVGCVANWRPRKGIELLIEAVDRLMETMPLHLMLVGDLRGSSIARRVAASRHSGRIHLLGPRVDAPAVAATFDVAVLPAIKREGLPKTVIEAMVQGVATVASDVGGVAEIIEDGISGLIVPPGDGVALSRSLAALYADRELRERLARAGRDRIMAAFRIEDTVRRTAETYASLVHERSSTKP